MFILWWETPQKPLIRTRETPSNESRIRSASGLDSCHIMQHLTPPHKFLAFTQGTINPFVQDMNLQLSTAQLFSPSISMSHPITPLNKID